VRRLEICAVRKKTFPHPVASVRKTEATWLGIIAQCLPNQLPNRKARTVGTIAGPRKRPKSQPELPSQTTRLAGMLRWLNIAAENPPREALLSEHPMQRLEPVLHRIDTSSGLPPVSTTLIC